MAQPTESPNVLMAVRKRSSNQSTTRMLPMYSGGNPTAFKTIIIVINPASGIPAAPIAASVAVTAITTICIIPSSNPAAIPAGEAW